MVSTQKNIVVTKANALITASYSLSLNEQRIILSCAAQLDGRKPIPKDNKFSLTVEQYKSQWGGDIKTIYRDMEAAANKLYERDIKKIGKKKKTRMRWVYMAEYMKGEGMIKLGFSPEITPYLTMLHKRFTSYRLSDVAELGSAYSVRLFEMLAQFQTTGLLRISVDELKERLQLEDKYGRFANLKARVINPATRELTQKTSVDVTWTPIKKGRNVETLEFRFEEKAQKELQL